MRKILIDAGHGGTDSGAAANGLVEKDIALDVALKIGAILSDVGFEVRQSRTEDVTLGINERWQVANAWGADLLVSAHANGGGGSGVETLIPTASPNNPGRDLEECRRLAALISCALAERFSLRLRRDNGVMLETETPLGSIGVLRHSSMIAVLVEPGFVDAPIGSPDLDMLRNDRQGIAQAIADGIFAFVGANDITTYQEEGWVWPVPGFTRVTHGFRRPSRPNHHGIDIARSLDPPREILGADIIAVADGKVAISAFEHPSWGNYVEIDHGGGIRSVYAHNQTNLVSKGQNMRRGEVIALVGNTGDSTGPHLHFERRENGRPVDPLLFLCPKRQYRPIIPSHASNVTSDRRFKVRIGNFDTEDEARAVRNEVWKVPGREDAFIIQEGEIWQVQAASGPNLDGAERIAAELRAAGIANVMVI